MPHLKQPTIINQLKQLELWLIGPSHMLPVPHTSNECMLLHTQVKCDVSGVMQIGLLLAYLKKAKECQIDLLDMHLVPPALNARLLSAVMTSFKYFKNTANCRWWDAKCNNTFRNSIFNLSGPNYHVLVWT